MLMSRLPEPFDLLRVWIRGTAGKHPECLRRRRTRCEGLDKIETGEVAGQDAQHPGGECRDDISDAENYAAPHGTAAKRSGCFPHKFAAADEVEFGPDAQLELGGHVMRQT